MRGLWVLLACASQFICAYTALAQVPDPNIYYRLSTEFRGTNMALDVFNGGPKNNRTHLTPVENVTGQLWHFAVQGDGTYRLTTKFRGPNRCLDIFNGGETDNEPHLTDCGAFTGQQWLIVSDGQWVRLKTKFRGDGMCLDIFNSGANNNQPQLRPCGNFSGQHWRLTAAGPVRPTEVEKVCRWDGTAPFCEGSCSGGWQFEARARTQAEADRLTWVQPAGGMPRFGEPCVPTKFKALCCRYQDVRR